MKNLLIRLFAAACASAAAAGAWAADPAYPAKPIHVIVPYPAGGVVDSFARVVTDAMRLRMKQPFVVESRPGASASLGTQAALRSEPDGYTWLISGPSVVANPLLFKGSDWNPVKDFAGVGVVAYAPLVMVVADKLPAKTLRDVVQMAKLKPDSLTAGTMYGSSTQFILEALKQTSDAKFLMVPYKGAPPIVLDLVNGGVQVSVLPITVALPQVQSGRIRAIAVASPTRSALLPDVPTFAEAGFPDAAFVPWYGFVVPRATPVAIVEQINLELNEALKSAELRERLIKMGGVLTQPMTPADTDRLIKSDYERYAELIKRGNIVAE